MMVHTLVTLKYVNNVICMEQGGELVGGAFSWLSTCIRLDFFAQQYDKVENISQFYLVL